jgi:hypothetical protein
MIIRSSADREKGRVTRSIPSVCFTTSYSGVSSPINKPSCVPARGTVCVGVSHIQVMFCEFWNLNVLQPIVPPFCISEKLTNIHLLMLPFIPATYPVFLVVVFCVIVEVHSRKIFSPVSKMWRVFFKTKHYHISTESVLQSIATLNFLSSTTNLYICASLFKETHVSYVSLSINSSQLEWKVLYFDPTVTFYSKEHLPYAVIALLLCVVLVVLPSLLLCWYPTKMYRYLSQYLSARKRLGITAFTETLHSCFKDGLNGTRDYRALAGIFVMIVPMSSLVAYVFSTTTNNAEILFYVMPVFSHRCCCRL